MPEGPNRHSGSAASDLILVIDDDQAVREALVHCVEFCGCNALTAGSRKQALELGRQAGWKFKAVLIDATLPGEESNAALTRQIKALNPGAKVFLMSGFSEATLISMGKQAAQADGFLQKPIQLQQVEALLKKP